MIAFLLLAALIWGVTNPLLKRYSSGMKQGGSLKEDLNHLMRRPGYLCIQLVNLSGSLFFFYALREVEVSIGSVVTNSLTFVITLLTSSFILCEGSLRVQTVIGCSLVMVGMTLLHSLILLTLLQVLLLRGSQRMKRIVRPKRWSQLNHVEHPPLMMKKLVQAACGGLRWIEAKNMAQYIAKRAINEGFNSTKKQRKALCVFPKKLPVECTKQKVQYNALALLPENQLITSRGKKKRVILYDVLDCTLGSGYHSGAVLENGGPYTRVVALDCDVAARDDARKISSEFGDDRFRFYCNRMSESLSMFGERSFDAVMIDSGPSVTQLEDPERGFLLDSDHCHDFDLRYSANSGLSALQYLNTVPQSTLSSALESYGLLSPEQSIKMARAVRTGRPFHHSSHLLSVITTAGFELPEDGWTLQGSWRKTHMSWKFLTSLRCIINNEMDEMAETVKNAFLMLRNNGRLIVITRLRWEEELISKFIQTHPHALLCYKEDADLDEVRRYGHTRHTKMWVASRIDKSAYVLKNTVSLTAEDVQKSSVQWMVGMFAGQTHGFPAHNFAFEHKDAKERRVEQRNEEAPPFDDGNDR